nr:unnamed protein product [Callosobruchus chinensis]
MGLDPAGPFFTVKNLDNRLDSTDAKFVQVVHTNDGFLGFSGQLGHADYYPNGGKTQPGDCSFFKYIDRRENEYLVCVSPSSKDIDKLLEVESREKLQAMETSKYFCIYGRLSISLKTKFLVIFYLLQIYLVVAFEDTWAFFGIYDSS